MADEEEAVVDEPITGGWSEEIPDDIQLFPEEKAADDEVKAEAPPAEEKPAAKPKPKAAAPVVEAAPPAAKEPPPAEEKKDEVPPSLQQMQRSIEERDRQVGERERAYRDADKWKKKAEEYDRFMEQMHSDPLAALQRAGANIPRMFEEKLGLAEPQTTEEKLHARLEAIEKERAEERAQSQTQAESDRFAAARDGVRRRQGQYLDSHSEIPMEDNPLAHLMAFKTQGAGTTWGKAEQYAQRTGRWLPDEEAARQAEESLRDEVEMVLDIASKMPQYRGRFVGEGQVAGKAESRRTPPGKTMSNNDTTTPPPAERKNVSLIGASDDEVLAAGLAAYARQVGAK